MGEIVALRDARPHGNPGTRRAGQADGQGKIVFLPCIRRERLVAPAEATKPKRDNPLTM
ncbi:hypothetical protein GTW51_13710 [Aurantimonas aggregata]|uniref:Uncharacterized protein n=1 Tax=Aurantimonas aggregata TaxID=2047720 RepID=A0A6L9MJF0_9HYPH|nr:hypothetical protein [Aurantimonas aggregata]NDV87758.1 hypothetical protein [Aurantimonas aggregata]